MKAQARSSAFVERSDHWPPDSRWAPIDQENHHVQSQELGLTALNHGTCARSTAPNVVKGSQIWPMVVAETEAGRRPPKPNAQRRRNGGRPPNMKTYSAAALPGHGLINLPWHWALTFSAAYQMNDSNNVKMRSSRLQCKQKGRHERLQTRSLSCTE